MYCMLSDFNAIDKFLSPPPSTLFLTNLGLSPLYDKAWCHSERSRRIYCGATYTYVQ